MTDALLACLDLEHEAVWRYSYLGARVDDTADEAHRSYNAHRAARDTLLARLAEKAIEPRSPAFSYAVPPADDAHGVRAAAREIEQRCATAYLALAGDTTAAAREFAVEELRRAARAVTTWDGEPVAFPGIPRRPR